MLLLPLLLAVRVTSYVLVNATNISRIYFYSFTNRNTNTNRLVE